MPEQTADKTVMAVGKGGRMTTEK